MPVIGAVCEKLNTPSGFGQMGPVDVSISKDNPQVEDEGQCVSTACNLCPPDRREVTVTDTYTSALIQARIAPTPRP